MNIASVFRTIFLPAAVVLTACWAASCGNDENFGIREAPGIHRSGSGNRQEFQETRRVLLFYECGFNTLSSALNDDINKELVQGYSTADQAAGLEKTYIPRGGRNNDVLLVFTKLAVGIAYKPVKSYLKRLYLDPEGALVTDTLAVYDEQMTAASKEGLRRVLTEVQARFPAKGYGLVFSSHGSGWLPPGYYNNPADFERSDGVSGKRIAPAGRQEDIPSGDLALTDPYSGFVRSIGQDINPQKDKKKGETDFEMTIADFTEALPMHLDYLLFDMCFSGGIEVAYALKDKTDYLGLSPAEVLEDGMFDYTQITRFLLKPSEYDLPGLMQHSFKRYFQLSGDYRSSTVNLVRTDRLEPLATVCRNLIERYRPALDNAPAGRIQRYYRMNRHYFYDLEDIFRKCAIPESELATLEDAIAACVVYRQATPSFLNSFDIVNYSGFSMYLPCRGTDFLDRHYREEAWNKAVELVK